MIGRCMKCMAMAFGAALLAFALVGCASTSAPGGSSSSSGGSASSGASASSSGTANDSFATDQMYSSSAYSEALYVFQIDGKTVTTNGCYTVDVNSGEPLRDGGFYKVIADVTYLNGGIAGYVDYPEVKSVYSCEEISPDELNLPSVLEKRYGLIRIGDYADGDLLLNEYGMKAVWKDGAWAYRYDDDFKLEDGTLVLFRTGADKDAIMAGIADGVLSCEDYFVVPAQAK